jgi:hypothetical protein
MYTRTPWKPDIVDSGRIRSMWPMLANGTAHIVPHVLNLLPDKFHESVMKHVSECNWHPIQRTCLFARRVPVAGLPME